MTDAKLAMLHGYRHLYRCALQAVMHSAPARYVARDQLRAAFREQGAVWDAEGLKRTGWFLKAAARERGLEHRILKNLLRVQSQRVGDRRVWKRTLAEGKNRNPLKHEKDAAFKHYEMTIAMLNKSMGLCLR